MQNGQLGGGGARGGGTVGNEYSDSKLRRQLARWRMPLLHSSPGGSIPKLGKIKAAWRAGHEGRGPGSNRRGTPPANITSNYGRMLGPDGRLYTRLYPTVRAAFTATVRGYPGEQRARVGQNPGP